MNRPGVLNRVSSLMRARNFNIESLAVSHTDQPDISRMTITLRGDDVAVEQVTKHQPGRPCANDADLGTDAGIPSHEYAIVLPC